MTPLPVVKFKTWTCRVDLGRYANNGRLCVRLVDVGNDSPVATASVNVEADLAFDEIAIKNHSENEGMLDAMIDAGLVFEEPIWMFRSGFVEIPICQMAPELLDAESRLWPRKARGW